MDANEARRVANAVRKSQKERREEEARRQQEQLQESRKEWCVEWFTKIEAEIRKAAQQGEFEIHYHTLCDDIAWQREQIQLWAGQTGFRADFSQAFIVEGDTDNETGQVHPGGWRQNVTIKWHPNESGNR